jgi:peptide/nickel transport system substrate-binding protein
MKHRIVGRIVLSATILLVAACTSGSDGAEQTPSGGATSLQGGTLRLAVPDFGTWFGYYSLDPQMYAAREIFRCCLLRTLYSYKGRPTEEGGAEARPDLAAGMPRISDDGLTWTFRLRPGLVYAPPFDDTPIVSRDLVRALERTAQLGEDGVWDFFVPVRGFEEYRSGDADSIGGLEAPDDRTLVVRLEQVTSDLAYRFSLPTTAPIPTGASDGHKMDYERFVVASGPYMVEGSDRIDFSVPPDAQQPASGYVPPMIVEEGEVQTPGSLVLVRNPSWDPEEDRLRPAYPDRIEVTFGGDDDEIARLVDEGDLDMVFGASSPFEQVSRYRGDAELAPRVYANSDDVQDAVTMNPAVPPFDDIHVRRAVALAIDRSALVAMLSVPPHGPFGQHAGEVATHVAPDAMEGGLLHAFDPYPFDPVRARAEMRLSAYDEDGDGRCDVSECRGLQTLVQDIGIFSEQARAVAAGLKLIGIDLELENRPITPKDRFHTPLLDPRSHTPMSIAFGWGKDLPVGSGWFPALFSFSSEGCCNFSLLGASPAQLRKWGYSVASVPSVDDRIRRCLGRRGVAHTECWAELDQYLMNEVVTYVPYTSRLQTRVVSDRVIEYSFDQFAAEPAFDRIALAPGSE